MVWACGKINEHPMTRRVLMAEVIGVGYEVDRGRLDGWCEGGHGQQRTNGGAARNCANDRKEWKSLVHMHLNEFHAAIFAWPIVLSDRSPLLW